MVANMAADDCDDEDEEDEQGESGYGDQVRYVQAMQCDNGKDSEGTATARAPFGNLKDTRNERTPSAASSVANSTSTKQGSTTQKTKKRSADKPQEPVTRKSSRERKGRKDSDHIYT